MLNPWLILREIALAILQGVTEIFPVSSSGHLIVWGEVLGLAVLYQQILFLHLGTFIAIFVFYQKDVFALLSGREGWKLPLYLVASFVMTVVVGLPVKLLFVDSLEQPQNVSYLWLINGAVVGLCGAFSPQGTRRMRDLRLREFLFIGAIQGITALPGISRLGWTLGAALIVGLTWFEALKLSFLLSLPTIFFGNLYEFGLKGLPGLPIWITDSNVANNPLFNANQSGSGLVIWLIIDVLVLVISFGFGMLALKVFSKYLSRRLLVYFGLYCLASGIFFVFFLELL